MLLFFVTAVYAVAFAIGLTFKTVMIIVDCSFDGLFGKDGAMELLRG